MQSWYQSRTVWILAGNGVAWLLILTGVDETSAQAAGHAFVENLIPILGIVASIAGYFARKAASGPLQGPVEQLKGGKQ